MKDWFRDGFFWRHPGSTGPGDLIYNTMSRIIDMNDKSDWAYTSLDWCILLLDRRKRWPNRLNKDNMAKNWFQWKWSQLLKNGKYSRPQGNMTRDPFIAVITCCLHLGVHEYIEHIRIPLHLYTPNTWRWKRRLVKDSRADWIQRLGYLKATATRMNYLSKSPPGS